MYYFVKSATYFLLLIFPIGIIFRDWKFHDKRTKKHHKITLTIIVLWFICSISATIFALHDNVQIKELQVKLHEEEMTKMESIETKVDKAINTEIKHYIEEIKTVKDGKTNRELYSRKILLKNKSINPKDGIDIYIKCDKRVSLAYVWSRDIFPIARKGGISKDGKTCDLKVFSSIPPNKELLIGLSSEEPFDILEIKYD